MSSLDGSTSTPTIRQPTNKPLHVSLLYFFGLQFCSFSKFLDGDQKHLIFTAALLLSDLLVSNSCFVTALSYCSESLLPSPLFHPKCIPSLALC